MPRLSIDKMYLPTIIGGGTIVILFSLWQLASEPIDERWFVLAGLTVLSGSATLRIPGITASFSISDSFTMAAALLFGPAAATLTVAIDGLVISLRLARRKLIPRRVLYNATAPPFAMWLSAQVFFLLAGTDPAALTSRSTLEIVGPLTAFAALFFVLNTGFVAGAISLEQRAAVLPIWREHFSGLWLTYFGGAAVAALLIVLVQGRHPDLLVLLLLAPIPLIIYATFRNAVGRMEDRIGHLDKVNQMYLSTIEALANAIDAKDQVTHCHLRRVQRYAMKLAHALGIKDEPQLRALEAASLLHDIGKLAVPEHILNKPSTLTPSEVERMKRHTSIGADILASIGFPYPVVPIVRHHHEAWDGSGYPAGLAAEAIPIGARILSVVDCFDALISDRPYRPRMTHEEAIRILQSRSGKTYDPRIVEKFLEIYDSVPTDPPSALPPEVLSNISTAQVDATRPLPSPYDTETLAALFDAGLEAAASLNVSEALARMHLVLQRLMPADTCVVYLHNQDVDGLVATHVTGAHAQAIKGTLIQIGQRLTGWVAANRQTIVNSDAALDLGNLTMKLDPTPQACMSSGIIVDGELAGVLTIYSTRKQPFTEAHAPILEVVAAGLGKLLRPRLATPASRRHPDSASASTRVH
jgi:putative nucleotidyltransferase with HDIG domain